MFEITGKLKGMNDTTFIGENETPKRLILVEFFSPSDKEHEHPNNLCVEFFGKENVDKLDYVESGEIVTVKFNLRSNKGNQKGQYFTSASGWFIKSEKPNSKKSESKNKKANDSKAVAKSESESESDDLLF